MEDLKKINGKENDIVQKGGGGSEKYQIMNVLLKSDILLGEGGWSKPMSFFQNVFLLIICQFLSSSCYILSSIFSKIASFFPIFDTNSHFIIDCCVNGKVWVKEICKKCLWCETGLEDLGFIFVLSSNENFHLSLLR